MQRRSKPCDFCFVGIQHPTLDKFVLWLEFPKTDLYGEGKFIPISTALAVIIDNWRIELRVDSHEILQEVTKTRRIDSTLTALRLGAKLNQ